MSGHLRDNQICLEVIHEGDHWIPCVYMTRVVETAMVDFKVQVRVEKVITKTPEGALRYRQIAVGLGKPVPVPSILVNGHLVYERIPGVDELKQTIHLMVKQLE